MSNCPMLSVHNYLIWIFHELNFVVLLSRHLYMAFDYNVCLYRPQTNCARRKPPVPHGLESHLGPVSHEWLDRIALKIIEMLKPYHDDNVGTKSAGSVFHPTKLRSNCLFQIHLTNHLRLTYYIIK